MIPIRMGAAVCFLLAFGVLLRAADTPASQLAAGPKDANGLTATLVLNKDTYTLDPSQAGKDFRDKIEAMRKGTGRPPALPQVDMVLRLTNTTDKDITISIGGDDSRVSLKLDGPGAISINPKMAMTMEFRMGKATLIPAGKTTDIKISSLMNGMRGVTEYNYWTEPGSYKVTPSLVYPNPKGEGQTTVVSALVGMKVK